MPRTWSGLQDILGGAVPSPADRLSPTPARFMTGVLPAYLCYYAMGILVVIPGTRLYRLSLMPVAIFQAFRAATKVDYAAGHAAHNFYNFGQCLCMITIAMRQVWWGTSNRPLERTRKAGIWRDAFDLVCNLRGVGWKYANISYLPPEKRPTTSKAAFLLATCARFLKCLVLYDAFDSIVRASAPPGVSTPTGGTIFDHSLPPIRRYASSTLISAVYGAVFYYAIEMAYYMATIVAFIIPGLNQEPQDWPTWSNAPWSATSLAEFWGRRWHQSNRPTFVALSTPLAYVFGRSGLVLGAFLYSAILHDWGMWGVGRGTNFKQTGGFFMLMGFGIIIESYWTKVTGHKVVGLCGWLWTATWMLACGNILVDGWMKAGLGGGETLPPFAQPVRLMLKYLCGVHL